MICHLYKKKKKSCSAQHKPPVVSYNTERAAYAHYSAPLYETRLGLFYSAERFADVPLPALLQNLQAFRVCGVIGYNYQPYGVGEAIKRFPGIQQ